MPHVVCSYTFGIAHWICYKLWCSHSGLRSFDQCI